MIDTRLSPAAVPPACRARADCTPPLCVVCEQPADAEIDASNAAAAVRRAAWPELTEGITVENDDR